MTDRSQDAIAHQHCCEPTRRRMLGGAAAAAALGSGGLLAACTPAVQGADANGRRIDVHHHFTPQAYLDFMRRHNTGPGLNLGGAAIRGAFRNWSLEADLADMNKAGTERAVLSITTPGFWFGEPGEVRRVLRDCNEAAAELRSDHPGRFGNFAAVVPTDTDGALAEIAYALDTLKAEGIGLFTNYGDIWLGHPSLAPVYEELNRRKAVVYVHPNTGSCCRNLVDDVGDTVVEYGTDTSRTIASLIFTGSTTRFPDIRWIFSHAGGTMPFLIERFLTGTEAEIVPGIVTKGQGSTPPPNVPGGVLPELRKMHYDTAQAANPVAMRALREVVGVRQIVYGTDFWYRTAEETARNLDGCGVFSAKELQMINRGNILSMLPQLAA